MLFNKQPVVSVIIPIYNAEEYLEQCLLSVINQTLQNIEIICIDDASTDNSTGIVERIAKDDYRVTLFRCVDHIGAGMARNRGIDNSHGIYLYFLDADDFLELNALESLVEQMEKSGSEIVVFDYLAFDDATLQPTISDYQFNFQYISQIKVNPFCALDFPQYFFQSFGNVVWNKLFKKTIITENSIRFQDVIKGNDMYFSWSCMLCAKKITTLNRKLIHYRRNTKSSITTVSSGDIYPYEIYGRIKNRLSDKNLYNTLRQSFDNLILALILCGLRTTKDKFDYYYEIVKNEWFPGLNLSGLDEEWFYSKNLYSEYKCFMDSKNPYEFLRNNAAILDNIIRQISGEYEVLSGEYSELLDKSRNHWNIIQNVDKMIDCDKKRISVEDYFVRKNYKNIAVYGLGYIGRYFVGMLEKTSVNIDYIIDRNANSDKYKVCSPDGYLPAVDAVIVTAVYYFDEIEDTLFDKMNCEIVSLEEVLYSI